jgi:MFS family permease
MQEKATIRLWRNGDFLKLWIGATVSLFGDQITDLAVPVLALVLLHVSAGQLGLLTAAEAAPILVVGLLAGVWVDRFHRRFIMVSADIGRAFLLVLVPIAAWLGILTFWLLVVVGFGAGVLSVFFSVANQSFLPTLLPQEDELLEGNARIALSESVAQVGGPTLAGLLLQIVAAPLAILLDSVSFLWSAAWLASIKVPEPVPSGTKRTQFWQDLFTGIRFVFTNPLLRALGACTATGSLFAVWITTVLLVYILRELHASAFILGIVFAAGNIGALAGAPLARPITRKFGRRKTLFFGPLLASCGALFLFGAHGPVLVAVFCIVLFQLLGRFGITVYSINQATLRQQETPRELRGRMNAAMRMFYLGVMPIGALLGGYLAQAFGLWPALVLGACGFLLPVVWLWFSPVRHLNR